MLPADLRERAAAAHAAGRAWVLTVPVTARLPGPAAENLPDEISRAARFRQEADRQAFLLGRLLVRAALGRPGEGFRLSPAGKPFLPGAPSFNLSHSGGLLALIVAPDQRAAGIDIEVQSAPHGYDDLIRRVCHPAERRLLLAEASAEARVRGFLTCWTRKEAVLKADGTGLTDDLPAIDTRLAEAVPLVVSPAGSPYRLWPLPTGRERAGGTIALPPDAPEPLIWQV